MRVERVDDVVGVDGAIRLDRAAGHRAGQQDREMVALVGQQVVGRGRREHVAELEQRQVGAAPGSRCTRRP